MMAVLAPAHIMSTLQDNQHINLLLTHSKVRLVLLCTRTTSIK